MRRARDWLVGAACVLLAWLLVLVCESLVVGFAALELFAGSWEIAAVRRLVLPIAIAALVPLAPLAVAAGKLLARAPDDRAARFACAGLGAVGGGAVAVGVSSGRHFASLAARVPFVVIVALFGALGFGVAKIISGEFDLSPYLTGRRDQR